MTILQTAYAQGQRDAFEKFAAGVSAAAIRGAVPRVPMAATAASNTAPSLQQVGATPRAPIGPAAPGPGMLANMGGLQGLASKAWSGINRVAANPAAQLGLGIGIPMVAGSLLSRSNPDDRR